MALSALVAPSRVAWAQRAPDSLEIGFRDPPASAKPRTWWHWTASNVTKEGITKDLEWMRRVGIAGMQLADVNAGGGQTVEKKIVFGTPEWLDAVRHAAAESDRLGLEMDLFGSPGWSLTGGPWVKPEQAMKKLVWSETSVQGPKRVPRRAPEAAEQQWADQESRARYDALGGSDLLCRRRGDRVSHAGRRAQHDGRASDRDDERRRE